MIKPATIQVTLTEAYENFSEYLNRAHYQGVEFVVLKRGKPFARIVTADRHAEKDEPSHKKLKTSAPPAAAKPHLHIPTDPTQLAAEFKANEVRLQELATAEVVRLMENGVLVVRGEAEVAERRQRLAFRDALHDALHDAMDAKDASLDHLATETLPSEAQRAARGIPVHQPSPVSQPTP